jgi:hypothetical protein
LHRNIREANSHTDDEVDALVELNLLSTHVRERGVARRIAFNLPAELRQALSLEARIEWIWRGELGNEAGHSSCYPESWIILRALAAKDIVVARRFFDGDCRPLRRGHRATVLLYNALLSIITHNEPLQRELLEPLGDRRTTGAFAAMFTILRAIILVDPSGIAEGLTQLLSTFRRLDNLFDEDKLICLLGHGLAELALEKDSNLLGEFDQGQAPSWDQAYFEWLRGESPSPSFPRLTKKSKLLDRLLNRLETPRWWTKADGDEE